MKRPLLLLSGILLYAAVFSQGIYSAVHTYFRHDPFEKPFAQFLSSLLNDPALTEKDIKKKTDSTLFFLQGTYRAYRPFFFPATHCRVVLAEQQEFTDSTETEAYTFFVYQLIGYAAPGDEGVRDVKEEFERLQRKWKKGLVDNGHRELKRGSETSGMIADYHYGYMLFNPVSIAWASSAGKKENIIALTVRFLLRENQAFLPITANSP